MHDISAHLEEEVDEAKVVLQNIALQHHHWVLHVWVHALEPAKAVSKSSQSKRHQQQTGTRTHAHAHTHSVCVCVRAHCSISAVTSKLLFTSTTPPSPQQQLTSLLHCAGTARQSPCRACPSQTQTAAGCRPLPTANSCAVVRVGGWWCWRRGEVSWEAGCENKHEKAGCYTHTGTHRQAGKQAGRYPLTHSHTHTHTAQHSAAHVDEPSSDERRVWTCCARCRLGNTRAPTPPLHSTRDQTHRGPAATHRRCACCRQR